MTSISQCIPSSRDSPDWFNIFSCHSHIAWNPQSAGFVWNHDLLSTRSEVYRKFHFKVRCICFYPWMTTDNSFRQSRRIEGSTLCAAARHKRLWKKLHTVKLQFENVLNNLYWCWCVVSGTPDPRVLWQSLVNHSANSQIYQSCSHDTNRESLKGVMWYWTNAIQCCAFLIQRLKQLH